MTMNFANITVSLAFLAGLASFLSPCVFSLVPAYIGYLSGRSMVAAQDENFNRWVTLSHGLAFVLGFSVVFVILGVAAAALGGLLYDLRTWIAKIGGVIVIIFGLHMIGIFRIKYLEYDLRPQSSPDRSRGYFSSALMGVFFSAGWSPCVGPVLGAILTLALNGGSISQGVVLLSAYSLGLAIPFLFAAMGIGWVTTLMRRYGKVMRYTEIVMGVILVIVGLMLFLGTFEQLARFGLFVDFGL
jgi:cytochrome c-type biogenesis protein